MIRKSTAIIALGALAALGACQSSTTDAKPSPSAAKAATKPSPAKSPTSPTTPGTRDWELWGRCQTTFVKNHPGLILADDEVTVIEAGEHLRIKVTDADDLDGKRVGTADCWWNPLTGAIHATLLH